MEILDYLCFRISLADCNSTSVSSLHHLHTRGCSKDSFQSHYINSHVRKWSHHILHSNIEFFRKLELYHRLRRKEWETEVKSGRVIIEFDVLYIICRDPKSILNTNDWIMSVVLSKLMTYFFLKLCLKKILLALIYLMKLHLDYKHWNTFWAHFIIWRFLFEIQICNIVRSMQFSFSFSLYIKIINGHRY